jgi:hypothetical protein
MTVTNKHFFHKYVKRRLNSGNVCYHSVQNILLHSLLSKDLKIKLNKTIILTVLYGCKTWSFSPHIESVWGEHLDLTERSQQEEEETYILYWYFSFLSKVVPVLKHHAMIMHLGVQANFYAFLQLALDGRVASFMLCPLYQRGKNPPHSLCIYSVTYPYNQSMFHIMYRVVGGGGGAFIT